MTKKAGLAGLQATWDLMATPIRSGNSFVSQLMTFEWTTVIYFPLQRFENEFNLAVVEKPNKK